MNFILKMAWRDSRASRRRLALFSMSIVLGIAALVAIGSFGANLERAINEQARGLLGADMMVQLRNPPSAEINRYFDSLGGERSHETTFSSMATFPAANNLTRLVQVRATDGKFPFFGDFTTVPADAPEKLRAGGDVAIIEETLLRQFDTEVGGQVKIGDTFYTVVGALQKFPGETNAVAATFAPRALVPLNSLARAGLDATHALGRYRVMFKLPDPLAADAIEREMRAQFREENPGVETVEDRKRSLGRALDNVEGFLSLVGFIALFLGAIGVASAVHVYVQQKIPTVAVLRCLGASAWQAFAVYLLQGLGLGVFGAALGTALGLAVQVGLPHVLADMLPFEVDFFVAWDAVARGVSAGLVICLLFTMLPLLAVRKVSPLTALRSAVADKSGQAPDPWRIAIGVFILGVVALFARWQLHSMWKGLGFAATLALGFAVLAGVAQAVSWAARKWFPRRSPYVVRQGVANLYRPQNRTVLLVLSLGLGTFLMLTLYLSRSTLLKEIETTAGGSRPNLLFFDIQDDQIEGIRKTAADLGSPVVVEAPIVTMKVASVHGVSAAELLQGGGRRGGTRMMDRLRGNTTGDAEAKAEDGTPIQRNPEGWTLRREYRSTFRSQLEPTERLIAGEFIPRVEPGTEIVPVSMEQGVVNDMGLVLGDEVEWDVQGVIIRTKLASIRAVEWRRLEPNFFVVFPAGVLEAAPKFHVAAMRVATPDDSARMQRAVVSAFPNVTAIDVALLMQTVDNIFEKVSFVIEFMALFTVATGIIVLAGAVMSGRFQRIRETVLLRTQGATKQQLTRIMLVEYAVLGVLAAVTGSLLAALGNELMARFIFQIPAAQPPIQFIGAVVASVTVTLVTGLLANRGVTDHPPLQVLRQET